MSDEFYSCEICNKVCPIEEMEKSGFLLLGVKKMGRPICKECAKRNELGIGWGAQWPAR